MWLFGASVAVASFIAVQAPFDKSAGANDGGLIGNNSFWGTYLLFNIFIALYLFIAPEAKQYKYLKYFAVMIKLI